MVVEIEGEQGSDVEAEYKLRVEILGEQGGVETVQTLDNNYGAVGESELMARPLALTLLKVEGGYLYLLALKQLAQLYAEEIGRASCRERVCLSV